MFKFQFVLEAVADIHMSTGLGGHIYLGCPKIWVHARCESWTRRIHGGCYSGRAGHAARLRLPSSPLSCGVAAAGLWIGCESLMAAQRRTATHKNNMWSCLLPQRYTCHSVVRGIKNKLHSFEIRGFEIRGMEILYGCSAFGRDHGEVPPPPHKRISKRTKGNRSRPHTRKGRSKLHTRKGA